MSAFQARAKAITNEENLCPFICCRLYFGSYRLRPALILYCNNNKTSRYSLSSCPSVVPWMVRCHQKNIRFGNDCLQNGHGEKMMCTSLERLILLHSWNAVRNCWILENRNCIFMDWALLCLEQFIWLFSLRGGYMAVLM